MADSTLRCAGCGKEQKTKAGKKGPRLPRQWKRSPQGLPYCPACWSERYVLRAVTIPIVRPLGEGIGWPELRPALQEAWSLSTAAVNWIMSELYARDVKREPAMEKLPPMPRVYLYPELRARFPRLPPATVVALEHAAAAKYRAQRYQVIWLCERSLPNARYPQPYPVHNQSWRPAYEPAGKDGGDLIPCIHVTLPGGRFLLQLRGGRDFRRQLADFRRLVEGQAIRGELVLMRRRVGGNERRNAIKDRDSGGQNAQYRVMAKMVGWFPRTPARERTGTLVVRTDSESFLVALDEKGEKIRVWHADHVRRWIAEHRRRLLRLADDSKSELRPRVPFQSRRERYVLRFRNRMQSFLRETAAQIAGVARRRRFATVSLDDSDRSYFGDRFDWTGFRTYLQQRLDQDGIRLVIASDQTVPKDGESLAEAES